MESDVAFPRVLQHRALVPSELNKLEPPKEVCGVRGRDFHGLGGLEDWLTGAFQAGLLSGFNREMCPCLRWKCIGRCIPNSHDTEPSPLRETSGPRVLRNTLLGMQFPQKVALWEDHPKLEIQA